MLVPMAVLGSQGARGPIVPGFARLIIQMGPRFLEKMENMQISNWDLQMISAQALRTLKLPLAGSVEV